MTHLEELEKELTKRSYDDFIAPIAVTLLGWFAVMVIPLSLAQRIIWGIAAATPVIVVFILEPLEKRAENRFQKLLELDEEDRKEHVG